MKHAGKATQAALKMILWSLMLIIGICAIGIIAKYLSHLIAAAGYLLLGAWLIFTGFVIYFFRDPDPNVPREKGLVLSPGHGVVDVIEEYSEPAFMGGSCQRVSMFLSPLDVHVQNAPVSGKVTYLRHNPGQFLAAMSSDCGLHNENVLYGIESGEKAGDKIGVRLIAGYLARRIVPWAKEGEEIERGDRISLIQFGSRCDVYLPKHVKVVVKLGERVKGGETVLARYE